MNYKKLKKGKDLFIDPKDNSTTRIARGTSCCGGNHQTIAGALLKSKEWRLWCEEVSRRLGDWRITTGKVPVPEAVFDTDETTMIDAMSDEHIMEFFSFVKKMK